MKRMILLVAGAASLMSCNSDYEVQDASTTWMHIDPYSIDISRGNASAYALACANFAYEAAEQQLKSALTDISAMYDADRYEHLAANYTAVAKFTDALVSTEVAEQYAKRKADVLTTIATIKAEKAAEAAKTAKSAAIDKLLAEYNSIFDALAGPPITDYNLLGVYHGKIIGMPGTFSKYMRDMTAEQRATYDKLMAKRGNNF